MKYYMKITHSGGQPFRLVVCSTDKHEAFMIATMRCFRMGIDTLGISIEYVE